MTNSKGGFHYGFLIVASFIAINFTALSFSISCGGVLFPSVAKTFGTATGTMSYYMTFVWATALISLSFLGKVYNKLGVRVMTSAVVVLTAAALVMQSLTQEAWQYMVCGIPIGLSVAIGLYLAPATTVNHWFKKRAGFFVGLVMAFLGVGGVVWSTVAGILIESIGWRLTLDVFAAITLIAGLPFSLFVLRGDPSEKGLLPYGAEASMGEGGAPISAADINSDGIEAKKAFRSRSFLYLCIFAFCINFGMYLYQLLASYVAAQPAGIEWPLLSSLVMSVAMAGQTVGKVGLGAMGDKNPLVGALIGLASGLAGIILLAIGSSSAALLFVGAAIFGVLYSLSNAMMPAITRNFYGMKEYSAIYSRLSMACTLGPTTSSFILGTAATMLGWDVTFGIVFAIIAIGLVGCLLAFRAIKELRP